MNIVDNLNYVQVINKPCMRSRCVSLLPRTTLHSDSEQLGQVIFIYVCLFIPIPNAFFHMYIEEIAEMKGQVRLGQVRVRLGQVRVKLGFGQGCVAVRGTVEGQVSPMGQTQPFTICVICRCVVSAVLQFLPFCISPFYTVLRFVLVLVQQFGRFFTILYFQHFAFGLSVIFDILSFAVM